MTAITLIICAKAALALVFATAYFVFHENQAGKDKK